MESFKHGWYDYPAELQVSAIGRIEHLYYDDDVNDLVPVSDLLIDEARGCCVLIGPHAAADVLLRLAAQLAVQQPVNILDAALRFDVHRVARLLRQRSTAIYDALERIELVRVFNACQLVDGLRAFERDRAPVLIFGALALFETDILGSQRERHLLVSYFDLLRRMGAERLLFVGLKPAERLRQAPWNQLLYDAARVYDLSMQEESQSAQQLDLFGGLDG